MCSRLRECVRDENEERERQNYHPTWYLCVLSYAPCHFSPLPYGGTGTQHTVHSQAFSSFLAPLGHSLACRGTWGRLVTGVAGRFQFATCFFGTATPRQVRMMHAGRCYAVPSSCGSCLACGYRVTLACMLLTSTGCSVRKQLVGIMIEKHKCHTKNMHARDSRCVANRQPAYIFDALAFLTAVVIQWLGRRRHPVALYSEGKQASSRIRSMPSLSPKHSSFCSLEDPMCAAREPAGLVASSQSDAAHTRETRRYPDAEYAQ